MSEFLKTWGALIVAFLALIQPWLMAFWRKYVRRQRVDVFETGNIELGFSSIGPTIGLYGTLRALHRDAFIRTIELRLVRQQDNLQHAFSWGIFRSPTVSLGDQQNPSFQLCSSFLLSEQSPFHYNIQFWDRQTQEQIRPLVEKLKEAWATAFLDAGGRQLLEQGVDLAAVAEEVRRATRELYSDFSQQELHVDVYTTLQRLCYWEPGGYSLEMALSTSRPKRTYNRRWSFEVSEKEADLLRLNTIKILQEACGQIYGAWNFVYPTYGEAAP